MTEPYNDNSVANTEDSETHITYLTNALQNWTDHEILEGVQVLLGRAEILTTFVEDGTGIYTGFKTIVASGDLQLESEVTNFTVPLQPFTLTVQGQMH